MLGKERDAGETVRAVEGAEEGLGAGLDEGRERDGEFADAEPARAARDVGLEREVGHGLEGEGVREEGVVGPLLGSLLSRVVPVVARGRSKGRRSRGSGVRSKGGSRRASLPFRGSGI